MPACDLELKFGLPLEALNGGLFVSRGKGTHPVRIIDSYELIVVRNGILRIFEGQNEFALSKGDALVLWPGKRHGGLSKYPRDLSFFWVHFRLRETKPTKPSSVKLIVPQLSRLSDLSGISELFFRFLSEQESKKTDRTVLSLILMSIFSEISRNPAKEEAGNPGQGQALAHKTMEYIRINFSSRNLSRRDVAAAMRCNPDYLGRIFRKEYGHSIISEIHRAKIKKARHLLIESRMNIDEISQECGFGDIAFFRRVFSRHLEMAPNEFRRQHSRIHVNTE